MWSPIEATSLKLHGLSKSARLNSIRATDEEGARAQKSESYQLSEQYAPLFLKCVPTDILSVPKPLYSPTENLAGVVVSELFARSIFEIVRAKAASHGFSSEVPMMRGSVTVIESKEA